MILQNIFAKGTVNRDLDPRFVDSDELIDCENFFVTTTDGSSVGVGKNALGNVLKTTYNILGGKTIGHGVDTSTSNIYNFIKGTLYDYIIEYNTETGNSAIVLQSSTGTRLNFKEGERILNVEIIVNEKPFYPNQAEGGNLIKFSGDSNPPRIANINRAKTWGLDGFTAEEITLIKAPPFYPPNVVQVNSSDLNENFLIDKFMTFAYRYKYKDDYYSAISTWQQYAFTPGRFNLDFATFENRGMQNIFNACNIFFNTGPREVIAIDLLFRESNTSTVYKVDQYVKSAKGWGDNTTQMIQFNNSKIYSTLPDDQFFRVCDYIPNESVASTFTQNRLFFANYREGKNLIDTNGNKVLIEDTVDLVATVFTSTNPVVSSFASTSPFDSSSIDKGRIRFNFSGNPLVKGAVIYLIFDIKANYTDDGDPVEDVFVNTYNFILDKDYLNIQALITDPDNDFKLNIEGYFSDYLKNTSLQIPFGTILPYTYNGFKVNVVTADTFDVVLPTVRYEINKTPDPNVFIDEYFKNNATTASVDSLGSKKSMKSYRSYEVCRVYFDDQKRPTTALTSATNTLFIPIQNSITQNQIKVTIPSTSKPPVGFSTYRFGIKENRGSYEEIYASIFYKDGVYRWIRLDGSNKNKVNVNDTLLVKRDISNNLSSVVKTKVLEIMQKDKDFITDNKDSNGNPIVETEGLYMKIKPEGFSIDYNDNEFISDEQSSAVKEDRPFVNLGADEFSPKNEGSGPPITYTDTPIVQGAVFNIVLHSDYHRDNERNDYEGNFIVNDNYNNFQDYYNAELAGIQFKGTNGKIFNKSVIRDNGQLVLRIEGTAAGNGTSRRGFLDAKMTLRSVSGYFIFETLGKEIETYTFFLTPDVFNIVNGEHQFSEHLLEKTFNCYVQGNGAESHQIRDDFNEKYVSIDFTPTAVSEDEYKEENRYADITYSGIFNSSTNINKLNEFNLSTGNFKDDIDKSYGPIYKLKGIETNLQVFQEDKDSFVYYGKDILYNQDGTSNLTSISDVLGSQDLYLGEYGISTHPESFDMYAGTVYHSDVKRGVMLKKTNNGLFEISSQNMNSYFKNLFRDNEINQVIGKYDQYNDVYIVNIKYNGTEYVTWVYSDKYDGWLGKTTFNPEDMCRVNNRFFSFKNGEVYEHNQEGRNTFYGIEYDSTFTFNFSQNPSDRKNYKTLNSESTDSWSFELETDIDKGFINKSDFVKQEGVFRAYIRNSNTEIDNSKLCVQGIGICTITGNTLNFTFDIDNFISIGDEIRTVSKLLVGKILSKTTNSLTLDNVSNIVNGDFVTCSKPQSVENSALLGYHMTVKATLRKNTKTEVYSVNAEVAKSFS